MSKIFLIIFISFNTSGFIIHAQIKHTMQEMHEQQIKEIPWYIFFTNLNAIALIATEKHTQQRQSSTYVTNKRIRHYLFYPPSFLSAFGVTNGIENLFTLHSTWSAIDNRFIPTSLPFLQATNAFTKTANIFYRLTKLFILDYPMNFVIPSLNHEFFGHGMRYYQSGLDVIKLHIPLPPPFQNTFPHIRNNFGSVYNLQNTTHQVVLSTIGGSEASTTMARIVRRNVLVSNSFDYRAAFLYLYANNDLNGYAAFAPEVSDIRFYKYLLNESLYKKSSKKLNNTTLLAYGLVGILGDPLNYYSFYTIFKQYLFDGNTSWRIPWIPISKIQYLPQVRFGLTPYGVEFFVNTYVAYENTVYALIVGFTDGTFDTSWRIQTKVWNIFIAPTMSLDLNVQLWQQPTIEFYVNNTLQISQGLGGAFFITYNYDKFINDLFGIMVRVGYKSAGFIEGHVLQSSFIAQLAFSVSFSL